MPQCDPAWLGIKRILVWAVFVEIACSVWAASPPPRQYILLEGSEIESYCLACPALPQSVAIRGRFTLEFDFENPLFTYYFIRDARFTDGLHSTNLVLTGAGSYQFGGEVALQQQIELDAVIDGQPVRLSNPIGAVTRLWPMIAVDLDNAGEVNGTRHRLRLRAAPAREIWFSVVNHLTPAAMDLGPVNPGDLLSSAGRVVRTRAALLAPYELTGPVEDIGIDALEIEPGGGVLFSLDREAFSGVMGSLQHGDLLSGTGERRYLSQQLVAPFGLFFDALDLGLDALKVRDDGEVLFSLREDYPTSSIGPLSHGDILSLGGTRLRTADSMYARFHPTERRDYGVDAMEIWSSGEIWFSPASGFQDEELGTIGHGDLLSDQGYIVFRNLELVGAFQPIEDLSDFGLNALFVVSDDPEPDQAPPHLFAPKAGDRIAGIALCWSGAGRVFQVERTAGWPADWRAVSPIMPGRAFVDPMDVQTGPLGIYRVRQW